MANKLRLIRTACELTQQQFSKITSVGQGRISHFERGLKRSDREAQALKMEVSALFLESWRGEVW